MREYGFEMRLCAHLETVTDGIVARQLGGGVRGGPRRILDIVTIEPGPEFSHRRAITSRTIPPLAIEHRVGTGSASRWPGDRDLAPETAARVRDRAVEAGFFERVRRNGREYVRQTTRYPDWIGAMTAIENKPDLDRPGDLSHQLRHDVSLGLVDRVILATRSHVTGAHLNRIPDAVGVWELEPTDEGLTIEEVRAPSTLDSDDWGLAVGDRHPVSRDAEPVEPFRKARSRIRLAERAYGKGWRPVLPACANIDPSVPPESDTLPYCTYYDRIVDPADCGPDCPGHNQSDAPPDRRSTERATRTPWDPNPVGHHREQAGLDDGPWAD